MGNINNCLNNARLVIPTSFEQCLSYEEQIRFLAEKVTELEARVEALENAQNAESESEG